MLDLSVSHSLLPTTTDMWWQKLRPRLILLYVVVALTLLVLSVSGHIRLLGDVGKTFGGFFWAIDTDGQVVVVSILPQSASFGASTSSITNSDTIVGVEVSDKKGQVLFNWQQSSQQHGTVPLVEAYLHANVGDTVTYTIRHSDATEDYTSLPALSFSFAMWLQNYGLALLAGLSWLLVGTVLFVRAKDWTGAVEGITLIPPAMLFLLYSHWGNVQTAYPADIVFQLLWVPSFALLGAAFIHLSLTYRPEVMLTPHRPRWLTDGLPYLPLIALIAFEWSSLLLFGKVAARPHLIISLSYGVFGGVLSFGIGIISLLRVLRILPGKQIPENVRHRLGDLLTLWFGGIGLGFCLGILPILLNGHPLLPLELFYVLAIVYPFLLLYAIRSLRLIDRLQVTLEQREDALREQQKTAEALRLTNSELTQATSLLLSADAQLRSVLSQRIHDQPKQQALRMRTILGHWQLKLKGEAEHDVSGKVPAQPIIETLEKVRKISEEMESDLRGLQILVEDAYQRRSLGLRLHLEKLIKEDLPALQPESQLKVKADLRALDALTRDLELTEEGTKVAEAISYTVTQALLNVYNHAEASHAAVQTSCKHGILEVSITDDGQGFDISSIAPEKTSLFKAKMKTREAGGIFSVQSIPRPLDGHGTTVLLRLPIPHVQQQVISSPLPELPLY